MADHLATQTEYPWRTAVRAGFFTLFGFLAAAAVASPLIGPFIDAYIPGSGAAVLGFGVFCGGLAFLFNRLGNLPAVAHFLTEIGFGPVPKKRKVRE